MVRYGVKSAYRSSVKTKRGGLFSLQQLLGHTSLEMVRRYVTLASAQVRVQHRKFSPMDRMNSGRVKWGRAGGYGGKNGSKAKRGLVPL